MKLNKIKLQNIRSYLSEEIEFPEGSVLLSGDIGSGKSTILLAIDFALFGLRKGSLSGGSLLRNGKNVGGVELYFEIDGKNVVVKRNLKRRNDSIVQNAGYIILNGVKKDGTALEIKDSVLNLLNYPRELLTKSKSLVYRYTVYTPQEEMKAILLGDREIRLDTLRRVFGIDKYKRIKENNEKFLSRLKEKIKFFSGFIVDLEDKRIERGKKEEQALELNEHLKKISDSVGEFVRKIEIKEKELKEIEEGIKKFNELKSELVVNSIYLKNKKESFETNLNELDKLEKEIFELSSIKRDLIDFSKDIFYKEEEIELNEKKHKEVLNSVNEFRIKIRNSESFKSEINELDVCPTCKQSVDLSYKNDLIDKEDKKVEEFMEKLRDSEEKSLEIDSFLKRNKKELEELRNKDKENFVIKLKLDSLEEKRSRFENIRKIQKTLEIEVEEFSNTIKVLEEEISKLMDVDERYKCGRKELDSLLEIKKELDIDKVSFEREIKSLKEVLGRLIEEIERKDKIKESITNFNDVKDFLDNYFINVLDVMEKKVLLRVYNDFNELFKNWFSILIWDEGLKISLDDDFSPKIEQNGYEISYEFLSGGEKTAAALSYRLALNQVINNLISIIKTSDLLILDEPTDGFSDDQLDRIKIVLDELKLKQVIIVSHESKIESFVDRVIKIVKEDHVSRVVG